MQLLIAGALAAAKVRITLREVETNVMHNLHVIAIGRARMFRQLKPNMEDPTMLKLLLNWLLSALALIIVAHVVPGFSVSSFVAALIAALVVGFVNATLGLILKIITFPLTLVTFGVFWFVINAIMLKLAAAFVPGFV